MKTCDGYHGERKEWVHGDEIKYHSFVVYVRV